MLTIQILDGGDTFYRPLERRPLLLGSADDADVQLHEADVAPHHARIEPVEGDPAGFKIVDLESAAGTKVNGDPIVQWRLGLGDRIEIGRSVLVVGQRVERPATVDDVLDRGVSGAVRSRRAAPKKGSKTPVLIAVAVAIALCTGIALWGGAGESAPEYVRDVARSVEAGEFDKARGLIASLRRDWTGPDASQRIDDMAREVEAVAAAVDECRQEILNGAATQTRAQQLTELRDRHKSDPKGARGRAARLLLSDLDELRLEGQRLARENRPAVPVDQVPSTGPQNSQPRVAELQATEQDAPVRPESSTPESSPPGSGGPSLEERLAEISRICTTDPGRALAALDEALENANEEDAVRFRRLRTQIDEELESEASTLIARARSMASSREKADLGRAVALLEGQQGRFPPGSGASEVRSELELLRGEFAEAEAKAEQGNSTDLVAIGEFVDAARTAEARGDFATAATLLENVATRVRATDPSYAKRIDGRRADVAVLAALDGWLVELIAGTAEKSLSLPTDEGELVALHVEDGHLRQTDGTLVPWLDLQPASLVELLDAAKAKRDVRLGAAVLSYRAGDSATAERVLLAIAGRGDVDAVVAGMVARGRGDLVVDARGYRVVDGAFVAVREIETKATAARIEKRIASAMRRDKKARGAELEKILAEGPDVLDAVIFALRSQLTEQVAKVEKHPFKKSWDRIGERRTELDERRVAALELIFDEQRYFYPYKPPAVSGAKASEYHKVQSEVDDLVRAVRDVYEQKGGEKKVPGSLRVAIERVDWLVSMLEEFAEPIDGALDRIAWVRTLPKEGPLHLRNFCWTKAERERLDEVERIRGFNSRKGEELSTGERSQVEITNGYRELLGRAPLAVNLKLVEATRGHADEMARLGYFSHFSPTPGRRTPYERMKLAGYERGIAENIANHPSASSAHHGWTHSSGHHRNLLMASHSEFAVGNVSKYWVQNFGNSSEYRDDEDY